MELKTRHIIGGNAANIIELTVTDWGGNSSITETITDLNGRIDENFIMELRQLADELEEQNQKIDEAELHNVGSSLPKVCKGCGTLSTKVIDKKYLACCPDNNYIPMEEYCKKAIYPEK